MSSSARLPVTLSCTVEGNSARAAVRPAVIFWIGIDRYTNLWSINLVCIVKGTLSSTDINVVPVSSSPTEGSMTSTPAWPLSDFYCYIFPRPMKFLCYPGEELKANTNVLFKKFNNNTLEKTLPFNERHYPYKEPFVVATVLGPNIQHSDGEGKHIDLGGRRAWFDERDAVRKRCLKYEGSDVRKALSDRHSGVAVDDTGLPPLPVIADVEMPDSILCLNRHVAHYQNAMNAKT
ncbi:uncharacterized protein EDB91DRAFT_510269 [Suillus paluster]|uniref:uncharacterized protein n=1 Tax=Suillus paluster TaxID=48578 RepID=UPI001B863BFD|nr:uncharacterized protein EDB91DRAFT_510269 [Suillus paluster]KAG1752310.1 hypothetical protein EDB91DRAFT_510269 [Suillus paluster]